MKCSARYLEYSKCSINVIHFYYKITKMSKFEVLKDKCTDIYSLLHIVSKI